MQDKSPIKLLIIAELDGDISLEDRTYLYNWISKSEDNKRYYAQIKDLWEASLADVFGFVEVSKEWERFNNRIAARPKINKKKSIKITWYRVAAIIVIGLLIANLLIENFKTKDQSYYTAIAPTGSISQTILPDGTIIYLNSGTEIKYDTKSKEKQREVYVDGEAWFDVAKDKKKPFVVHTKYYNVRVLGTQFNVKNYKDDESIVTTLEEGSIQILGSDNLKLKETITLKPGEQISYNKTGHKVYKKNVDTQIFTSWRNNKLVFLEMTFGELVKLLERKYGVEIQVADSSILGEHYSGTIKNETIIEILNIIQHTHPITYKVEGQKIIIQKR